MTWAPSIRQIISRFLDSTRFSQISVIARIKYLIEARKELYSIGSRIVVPKQEQEVP